MSSIEELVKRIENKRKIEIIKPRIAIPAAAKVVKQIGTAFDKNFAVDDNNKEAYNQLIYYFLRHEQFDGDLNKGLLIVGKYGTGKTMAFDIMNEFVKFYKLDHYPFNLGFNISDVNHIVAEYENEQSGGETRIKIYKNKAAWCFNDLGKEISEQNFAVHYGKKINIMEKIFASRYILFTDYGIKTHATSNYKLENKDGQRPFKSFYGEYIDDRMKQMFNTLVFKGNSRRH